MCKNIKWVEPDMMYQEMEKYTSKYLFCLAKNVHAVNLFRLPLYLDKTKK